MLDISEDIRLAYKLKELFYQMMDSHDLGEVKARYKRWIMEAEQAGLEEFKACILNIAERRKKQADNANTCFLLAELYGEFFLATFSPQLLIKKLKYVL